MGWGNGAGGDGFMIKPALEVFCECQGGVVAVGGIFFEALENDRFEVGVAFSVGKAEARGGVFGDAAEEVCGRVSLDRKLAGEELVENRTEAIDVRCGGDVRAVSPLLQGLEVFPT